MVGGGQRTRSDRRAGPGGRGLAEWCDVNLTATRFSTKLNGLVSKNKATAEVTAILKRYQQYGPTIVQSCDVSSKRRSMERATGTRPHQHRRSPAESSRAKFEGWRNSWPRLGWPQLRPSSPARQLRSAGALVAVLRRSPTRPGAANKVDADRPTPLLGASTPS